MLRPIRLSSHCTCVFVLSLKKKKSKKNNWSPWKSKHLMWNVLKWGSSNILKLSCRMMEKQGRLPYLDILAVCQASRNLPILTSVSRQLILTGLQMSVGSGWVTRFSLLPGVCVCEWLHSFRCKINIHARCTQVDETPQNTYCAPKSSDGGWKWSGLPLSREYEDALVERRTEDLHLLNLIHRPLTRVTSQPTQQFELRGKYKWQEGQCWYSRKWKRWCQGLATPQQPSCLLSTEGTSLQPLWGGRTIILSRNPTN